MIVVLNPTHACRVGCSFCYFPGRARALRAGELEESLSLLEEHLGRFPIESLHVSVNDTGGGLGLWEEYLRAVRRSAGETPVEVTTTAGAALGISADTWSLCRRVSLSADREKGAGEHAFERTRAGLLRIREAGPAVSLNFLLNETEHLARWAELRDRWLELVEHVYLIVLKPVDRYFAGERELQERIEAADRALGSVRELAILDTCYAHRLGVRRSPTCAERIELGPGREVRRCPHDSPRPADGRREERPGLTACPHLVFPEG
jgi:hypothetical protein